MDLLTAEPVLERGWLVVRARGQLDVATAPAFDEVLESAAHQGADRLAVDLDGVEFVDSLGLGVLLAAVKRARAHGTRFAVVCGRGDVRRLLEQTRLDRIVTVVGSVGELDHDAATGADPSTAPPNGRG